MALINSLTDKFQYILSHSCAKDTEHKRTQNIESMHGGQASHPCTWMQLCTPFTTGPGAGLEMRAG